MDLDDILGAPRGSGSDALATLVREDLDRLSIAELEARIAALEGEIARSRRRIDQAARDRASADELFRR